MANSWTLYDKAVAVLRYFFSKETDFKRPVCKDFSFAVSLISVQLFLYRQGKDSDPTKSDGTEMDGSLPLG